MSRSKGFWIGMGFWSGKLALVLWIVNWGVKTNVNACVGPPRPPICGKTVVFAKASPPHQIINNPTGQVNFTVPVTVFIERTAGCDLLPTPVVPVSVSISLTVGCTPGPSGSGTLVSGNLFDGYNNFQVPVTVPAGQPRICNITGTAAVTFSDGMTLTGSGDTVVCLVEEAPTIPDTPRLDLELLTPSIDLVHPGDQAVMRYRLTNNDDSESFSGTFTAGIQTATVEPLEGIMYNPDGSGAYVVADPVADHFPIAFEDDLLPGLCVPLPLDPQLTQPGSRDRVIVLDPGEERIISVIARPWGTCANGSCNEATVVLDGNFSDQSQGFACAGAVVGADTNQVPDFQCPGSGMAATFSVVDPLTAQGRFTAQDALGNDIVLDFDYNTLDFEGLPPNPANDFLERLTDHVGRAQYFVQGPFLSLSTLAGESELRVSPNGMLTPIWREIKPVGGASFEDIGPTTKNKVEIDVDGDMMPDFCVETLVRGSLFSFDDGDFFVPSKPITESELFEDGFSSGNITRWSFEMPPSRGNNMIDGFQLYFETSAFISETTAPYPCPMDTTADFDADGLVTENDLETLYPDFVQSAASPRDRDGDQTITVRDLLQVSAKVGCQEAGAPAFARKQ